MTILVNGAPVEYDRAPENCRGTLERYIEHGIPTGSFMQAFLSNDLMDAMRRADNQNAHQFHAIASWLYNYAPPNCYGSPKMYADWLQSRQTQKGE